MQKADIHQIGIQAKKENNTRRENNELKILVDKVEVLYTFDC